MNSIENIINNINNLPTLPLVYSRLTEAIEDPDNTVEHISKIIASDQASAFKILKVANSPFYGFRGKIDTISQAIFYLGFNEVSNIVLSLSVIKMFSNEASLKKHNPLDLWAHSIGVGLLARAVGVAIKEKELENYFLAGIFHDIGKLIFMLFAAEEYRRVVELAKSKKITVTDAENELFGNDHSVAGFLLAEKWKLPILIQNTVRNHHNFTENDKNNLLLGSIYISNIYSKAIGLGYDGYSVIPRPTGIVWDTIKLNPGYIKSISKRITEDFNHSISTLLVD